MPASQIPTRFLKLPSSSGGYKKQTEVDFGSTPVSEKGFVVTDTDMTASSIVNVSIAGDAPTGKDADETEMDNFYITARPANGSVYFFIACLTGSFVGNLKINYSF